MVTTSVELVGVDETVLAALLATAVAEAEPGEVMAPVAGPPGWTPRRRDAFVAYHRGRQASGFPDPEVTFAVTVDGEVAGALRLAAVAGEPSTLEVGVWLGRRFRGRGVGRAVLTPAANRARAVGAHHLLARTTASNPAAVAVLRGEGYRVVHEDGDAVEARLALR